MNSGTRTADDEAAVEITDLAVRRGGTAVLRGVTVRLERGEAVRLAGPNGCGKSTLLNVLAGLTPPSSGTVKVWGRAPDHRGVRAQRGFLQEPPPLYDHLTVREQAALVGGVWGCGPVHSRTGSPHSASARTAGTY